MGIKVSIKVANYMTYIFSTKYLIFHLYEQILIHTFCFLNLWLWLCLICSKSDLFLDNNIYLSMLLQYILQPKPTILSPNSNFLQIEIENIDIVTKRGSWGDLGRLDFIRNEKLDIITPVWFSHFVANKLTGHKEKQRGLWFLWMHN